jgi:hypothetical protein
MVQAMILTIMLLLGVVLAVFSKFEEEAVAMLEALVNALSL